jgi:Rrf2 family protein
MGEFMHITLETDYAIRIVETMSVCNCKASAEEIASKSGVTSRFALKILRKLSLAGIVKSFKGSQGGYVLSRTPSEISLREVMEAVEGTYNLSRCLGEDYTCTSADGAESFGCRFHPVFCEISEMVRQRLSKVTFGSEDGTPASDTCTACGKAKCPKE